MGYEDTKKLFQTHVVECVAVRRIPKAGYAPTRRFLCTLSWPLLNSIPGKSVFHFRASGHQPPFDAKSYNLVTVFDLFRQEWRNVNLNQYKVLGGTPVRNQDEINKFWEFFNGFLIKMSSRDKINFMNK